MRIYRSEFKALQHTLSGSTMAVFDATVGIHPTAAEEFVAMREPAA